MDPEGSRRGKGGGGVGSNLGALCEYSHFQSLELRPRSRLLGTINIFFKRAYINSTNKKVLSRIHNVRL